MKRLEDVAPAHAVEPLARILELQAVDPTASTSVRSVAEAIDRLQFENALQRRDGHGGRDVGQMFHVKRGPS